MDDRRGRISIQLIFRHDNLSSESRNPHYHESTIINQGSAKPLWSGIQKGYTGFFSSNDQ